MNKTNDSFKSKAEYTKGILTEVKQWIPIPYRISSISSELKPNSAASLIESPHPNQGWLSDKNCSFPQEIQLYFPQEVIIRQIQIRLHQYIIPSKIEIYINQPNTTQMKKIGHLCPNNNEANNYQAREQKSVFTEHNCTKMKLALMKYHHNHLNTHSQVGMIALTILGTYPDVKDKLFTIVNEEEKNANDENYESVIASEKKLKELIHKKKIAIDKEDYEKAQEYKKQIEQANAMIINLKKLEKEKLNAINNEDYDEAKDIKFKIDEVKSSILFIGLCEIGVNCSSSNQIESHLPKKGIKEPEMIANQKEEEEVKASIMIVANNSKKKKDNINKTQPPLKGKHKNEKDFHNQQAKRNGEMNNQLKAEEGVKPKKIIDVDSITVDNKIKEKSSNVISTTNCLSDNNKNNDKDDNKPHSIYDDTISKAFSFSITKMIFHSDWKVKEDFLIKIQEEINLFPNSTIFTSLEEEGVIQGIIAVCNYILETNNIQVLLGGLDLVMCFNNSSLAKAYYNLDNLPLECLKRLIDRLGDIHQRVQEKVEAAIISFANCAYVGSITIIKQLVNGQIPKRLLTSSKHSTARYNFLYKLINQFGLPNQKDDLLENTIKMVKKGIDSNKKDIRDSAFALVYPLYSTIGDSLRKKLEGIRQQSLNQYDEVIRKIKGETEINRQDVFESTDINSKETEGELCLFCRSFNGNPTQMKTHHSTKCPMITICKICSKMVEISNLNNHLLEKCESKNQYKQCPRCKEAIDQREFNQHTSVNNCLRLNEQKTTMRCPLCHHDIEGWTVHLLTNGCPSNPRKNKKQI